MEVEDTSLGKVSGEKGVKAHAHQLEFRVRTADLAQEDTSAMEVAFAWFPLEIAEVKAELYGEILRFLRVASCVES